MRGRSLLLAALVGCGGGDTVSSDAQVAASESHSAGAAVEASDQAPIPEVRPAPQVSTVPTSKGGKTPPVVLVWSGISELHKAFFTTQDVVTTMSEALTPAVAPPANVHIGFDSKRHKGWIFLKLRPATLVLPVGGEDGRIQLQDLAPITTALAGYRSTVAGRFDVRIESFKVGIESFRGPVHCVFGAGGLRPPDGRTVSSCVEINGVSHCGEEEPGGLRFSPEIAAKIRACLG